MLNMKIHCIGDSHVSVFTGLEEIKTHPEYPNRYDDQYELFSSYRLGPLTAYNSFKIKSDIIKIINLFIKPEDYILLSFGEIDCRLHILKQVEKQNISIEQAVDICTNRYLDLIKDLRKEHDKIIIYLPPASTADFIENDEYGTLGDTNTRNRVTKYFEDNIKTKCKDVSFLSIYKYLIDEVNNTNMVYYEDQIHLSPLKVKDFIIKELNENGIWHGKDFNKISN